MTIIFIAYIALVILLTLILDLKRAYLILSPVPVVTYLFFNIASIGLGIIGVLAGFILLIVFRKDKPNCKRVLIGMLIYSLPLLYFLSIANTQRIF